jgi:LmeA-like phospholipid-binding/zinc-ribbon domain
MDELPERYCSNCGHELKPEDRFCSNCGMPVHRAARIPTPEADRPVPPLPPPTQEIGRRRSFPGSGTLRGRGRTLVILLVLGGLLLYLVLPLVMESLIAWRLQTAFGTPTKPNVEVSSNFPPELLLGRIDRIQVRMDQATLQGAALYNAEADLKGVNVSVPSLLGGNPTIETQSCSLSAEAPAFFIDQNQACLNYLGLGAGY